MSTILNILVIEDDPELYQEISHQIAVSPHFHLLGITQNTDKALESVKNEHPEIIILEIELNHGNGNGLEILKRIRELSLIRTPYILVNTRNRSTCTYEIARQLGADFIFPKHQEDYSGKKVMDFLEMLYPILLTIHAGSSTDISQKSIKPTTNQLRRHILSELNKIGINPKTMGYDYLADGILLIMQGQTKNIFAQIGINCAKTNTSVERAMQNAIKRAWRTTDIHVLSQYYTATIRPDRGEPTAMEFLHYYARKIQNEYSI